jgi:hypothetical protein
VPVAVFVLRVAFVPARFVVLFVARFPPVLAVLFVLVARVGIKSLHCWDACRPSPRSQRDLWSCFIRLLSLKATRGNLQPSYEVLFALAVAGAIYLAQCAAAKESFPLNLARNELEIPL